jgi:MFS family permease
MVGALAARLTESASGFKAVFRNRNLRLLELAWSGSVIGHYGYAVGLGVFAYQMAGAAAVGLVYLLRMLPAAIASPFASVLGDRYPRIRVMLASDLVRAGLTAAAAAVVATDAPAAVVYALSSLVAVVGTAFRPAQVAVLPSLSTMPNELTAANVVATTIEGLGMFVGPALAGLLLTFTGTTAIFVASALAFLLSAALLVLIESPEGQARSAGRVTIADELLAGFRVIWREGSLRLLVGLITAQTLVAGAINVLIVVSALELLDLGQPGVGFLDAAVGVGGLLGAVVVVPLVGGRKLSPPFLAGILFWGVPMVVLGVWPEPTAAFVLFALVGVGSTLVDVAGFTLLQRAVDDAVLARVFGVVETLFYVSIGVGALLVAPLVAWLGVQGALIVTGAFLPVLVVLLGARVFRIDEAASAPVQEVELLRGVPMFAPLPLMVLEKLALKLVRGEVTAGTEVIRQGDVGDRYYVVAAGELDAAVDGAVVASMGCGQGFGEIALLRDIPRTATVVARTDAELYALERDDFIGAVTGHLPSAEAAHSVVAVRLSSVLGAA